MTRSTLMHPASRIRWAGLGGRELAGDGEPAIVLLHGLTFDHRMWDPVMDALPVGVRAIALDLPGHGGSRLPDAPGLAPAVSAIHAAVVDAGNDRPIVVGHSIGGPLATIYVGEHPAAAVISVEAPIRLESFAAGMTAAAPHLRGPGFEDAWSRFRDSFGIDLVPADRRPLLA